MSGFCLYSPSTDRTLVASSLVPAGSPSRGRDVAVYVFDIN